MIDNRKTDRRVEHYWPEVDRRKATEDRRDDRLTQTDRDEIIRDREERNGDGRHNEIGR